MLMAILAIAAGACPALAAKTVPAKLALVPGSSVAPADEYFGPQRISVLGVRTMLDRAETRLDYGVGDDSATHRSLFLAEATMRAWQARYPNDYWLPRMFARLQTLYARMSGPDVQFRCADVASLLIVDFPASNEAQAMRAIVARAIAVPPAPEGKDSTTTADAATTAVAATVKP